MKSSLVLLTVLVIGRVMWYRAGAVGAEDADVVNAAMAIAVAEGDAVAVARCLRAGAETTDAAGVPLLGIAAWYGQEHVVRQLMDDGHDVNAAAPTGWTPLMMASLMGEAGVVETLLRAGANPFAETDAGATAMSVAIERGYEEIVERLVEARTTFAWRGRQPLACAP
jgi:hypothetical protein